MPHRAAAILVLCLVLTGCTGPRDGPATPPGISPAPMNDAATTGGAGPGGAGGDDGQPSRGQGSTTRTFQAPTWESGEWWEIVSTDAGAEPLRIVRVVLRVGIPCGEGTCAHVVDAIRLPEGATFAESRLVEPARLATLLPDGTAHAAIPFPLSEGTSWERTEDDGTPSSCRALAPRDGPSGSFDQLPILCSAGDAAWQEVYSSAARSVVERTPQGSDAPTWRMERHGRGDAPVPEDVALPQAPAVGTRWTFETRASPSAPAVLSTRVLIALDAACAEDIPGGCAERRDEAEGTASTTLLDMWTLSTVTGGERFDDLLLPLYPGKSWFGLQGEWGDARCIVLDLETRPVAGIGERRAFPVFCDLDAGGNLTRYYSPDLSAYVETVIRHGEDSWSAERLTAAALPKEA